MRSPFPMVSVIMPVHNGDRYLHESVKSILNQSFTNFEFIIINDGSTDQTGDLLKEYQQFDERILVKNNQNKQGIVESLNQGLEIAKGKYIARMDADDISLPKRFEKQVDYLESHSIIGLLGCGAIFIDERGQKLSNMERPQDDISIRWMSLLENPFFHPTTMIRRSILEDNNLNYHSEAQGVEDYDLWTRALEFTHGANLNKSYLYYRVHTDSFSSQSRINQNEKQVQISWNYINKKLPNSMISPEIHPELVAVFSGRLETSKKYLRPKLAFEYLKLWQEFSKIHNDFPGITKEKHGMSVLTAKIGLFPLFQPGWFKLLGKLTSEDFFWLFYFLIDLPKMIKGKLISKKLATLRSS